MGNALQSVSKAVDAKFIGGNPLESKFAAIDEGIKGVKAWKDNIDKQRLDLKTKTAEQIREAEKYAYENMPNSETAKTRILADLAKYKEQMLMNERLVRNGSIPPEENLIFFENGKQTFEIYADMVNNFDKELTLTEQRAKGYYKDNDDGTKTFVPPVAGELEAIKQQIQTQIGTLSGIETNFTEQGMGDVTFFQMEVDPVTNTYREKRDAKGNKIPLANTQPNMSVLALSHKANTRSDRRYLSNEVDEFSNQTSLTYDTMFSEGLMVGNVVTDARNNPELATLIENKTAALTTDIDAVASYFGKDNGFGGQLVSFTQWDNLTDEQKNETITVTILDENLDEKQITYKKYAKVAAANSNNAIVPELDADQIAAAQGHVRKSLVAGLQKKIAKGNKVQQFDPNSTGSRANKKALNTGQSVIRALNNLRGATTPEEVELSLQKLSGLSGLKYKEVEETRETDGQGNEFVTGVTLNLGGQIIPVEFGQMQGEGADRKFVQTSGADFIDANYEYFAGEDAVEFDEAFSNMPKDFKLFKDVSQLPKGSRNRKYDSKKTISIGQAYKVGGKDTTLSTQLEDVFNVADAATWNGVDLENLASGVKSTLTTALQAQGVDIPPGFTVYEDVGGKITIEYTDNEGIPVEFSQKISGDDDDYKLLEGVVTDFLTQLQR